MNSDKYTIITYDSQMNTLKIDISDYVSQDDDNAIIHMNFLSTRLFPAGFRNFTLYKNDKKLKEISIKVIINS